MPTFSPGDIAEMVSIGEIAQANGHSRMAVSKAVKRFKIKPLLEKPYRLFDPGIIPDLRNRMRKGRAGQP